jgi:hypothetical protein
MASLGRPRHQPGCGAKGPGWRTSPLRLLQPGPLLADNTRCPGCDGAKPFKLGPGGRAERLGRPEFDDKRVLVAPALNGHGLEVASVKR